MMIVRPAQRKDVPQIFSLIRKLAEYENLAHEFHGNVSDLENHLFGERRFLEAFVGEVNGELVGYALYFFNYSTFLTKPGIYLEDLFVLESFRNQGLGRALLNAIGKKAAEIGAGRIEWSVLDWNEGAIRFYKSLGAKILPDWRICRLSGEDLDQFIKVSRSIFPQQPKDLHP